MGRYKRIILFYVVSFVAYEFVSAQVVDEISIKTALISSFVENCYWPNEEEKAQYTLFLLGDDQELFSAINKDLVPRKFHNKSLVVTETTDPRECANADIVFVASSHSDVIKSIYENISGKPILLLSDNAKSKGQLMINFIRIKNKVGYQINPLNLIRQGFKIDKELLIYADNTMDYPDQFVEIEKELAEQRDRIAEREVKITEQENIITKKENDTWKLEQKLDEMTTSIEAYEQTIHDQESKIEESSFQLDSLSILLADDKELLSAFRDSIDNNRTWINNQESEIQQHSAKIQEQLKTLDEQKKILSTLDKQVKQQKESISRQELVIKKQSEIIIIFSILVSVIIVLAILSFIGFQRNKKARIILKRQNEEIALSKEMLQKQTDKLKQAKEKIEEYNLKLEDINQNLEHEVEQRTKHLTKTNKELDRFVYSVSHDIKAPLASIMGIVNLMKYEQLEDVITEYISKIESSVIKLNLFITEVLEFSRNARTEVNKEEVDLEETIHGVFNELKYLQEKIEVNFDVQVEENKPLITDKSRLIVILKNLISNSLKYYNPAKSNCSISIRAKVVDKNCWIVVADNGKGIKAEHHEKIFNMFYRAHENSEGSGLGLYIVKETLDKIKGKIKIKSISGEGTRVILLVPNYLRDVPQEKEFSLN